MAFSSKLHSIYRQGASRSFHWTVNRNFRRRISSGAEPPSRRSPSDVSPPPSPWLVMPPDYVSGHLLYKFQSLAGNKVISAGGCFGEGELRDKCIWRIVGSSHGWLALYNEDDKELFLSNPLSRRHIKLPPLQTIPTPTEEDVDWLCPKKLIISCSPEEDECRAIMIFGAHSRLAFCCPGRSSTEWTPFGALYYAEKEHTHELFDEGRPVPRSYEDFVYSRKRNHLFCFTMFQDLEAWDLGDPRSPSLYWKKNAMSDLEHDPFKYPWAAETEEEIAVKLDWEHRMYLVVAEEESDQLFLVARGISGTNVDLPHKTVGFDVHKFDPEKGQRLEYMDASLDGLAMFIGLNHAFTLSAAAATHISLKPNSIYFTDDKDFTPRDGDDRAYDGHDVGIFHYENATFSPCYYPHDIRSVNRIKPTPMWFTSSLPN